MIKRTLKAITALTALSLVAAPAMAIDISPGDYTVNPSGVNLGLLYLQYTSSDELKVDGAGKIPNSSLDTNVALLRYLHYSDIGGLPVAYQAFIPFGQLTNVRIGGGKPEVNNGVGDLTLGFTAFLVKPENPATGWTVGLTPYLVLPTGNYDVDKPSIGSGTYTFMPQLGVIKGFGNGFFLDLAADVSIQKDHDDKGIEVSTDPAYQYQAYLRYQFSPATALSFGYNGVYGGDQHLNGVYTGQRSRTDGVRVFLSRFVSPTFQIQSQIGTEFNAEGGFRDGTFAQLRLLKVF
jgi:hypothetical protein